MPGSLGEMGFPSSWREWSHVCRGAKGIWCYKVDLEGATERAGGLNRALLGKLSGRNPNFHHPRTLVRKILIWIFPVRITPCVLTLLVTFGDFRSPEVRVLLSSEKVALEVLVWLILSSSCLLLKALLLAVNAEPSLPNSCLHLELLLQIAKCKHEACRRVNLLPFEYSLCWGWERDELNDRKP